MIKKILAITLAFFLGVAVTVTGTTLANPKNDNGVPGFGVYKENYLAWWKEKAKTDEYAKEKLEEFNQMNKGQQNKFLKSTLNSKNAKEMLDKWAKGDLPKNKKVSVGDDGAYVEAKSTTLTTDKGKEIKNVKSLAELPDGSYYYKFVLSGGYYYGDLELETTQLWVTVFATVKDGEITADNATGGHDNLNPFLHVTDGVSSAFTQGDWAIGNQPFEIEASVFGFIDIGFLSRTVNVYAYIDRKEGIGSGWYEE
ncbi:hypothetical protein GXN76_15800 [Kroppenstedtia pulmonis]|uniref:Uncharacterized protein n=1 Tax=Kroppenstedtia pulmonis TaxID=1380685 RepID=A0A7D4BHC9_9BACL|nr:hypothetical protein [Kroppenstedtia pulmonis]QKG85772.1 hypothetical protein GXN76_15800 [Kroppenstedtia pulmonis]